MKTSSRLLRSLALSLLLLASIFTGLPGLRDMVVLKSRAQTTVSYALSGSRTVGWNGTIPGPDLRASIGDTVSLSLSSADGAPHRFFVDVNNNGVADCTSGPDKCQPSSFTTTATYSFSVDSATFSPATSYHYYCAIHPNMIGSFKVNAAAPASPDFAVSANPTSISTVQNSSATSSISIASQNGFNGALTLSTNTPPSGLSWRLNPSGVTLTSGATASSILTINASAAASTGAYQAVVTATNGTLTHTFTVNINITSLATPSANYLPEIGIAVIVAAIAVIGVLWYRTSRARRKLQNARRH